MMTCHMQAGYFVMDSSNDRYQPPPALTAFLETHAAPVYIGFGSLVYSNPEVPHRLCLLTVLQD